MAEREVKKWVTVNGKHIPIFEDEPIDDRDKRIKEINEQEYQYHATTSDAIWNIVDKGLKPGRGHMGSGIYFAPTPDDALEWTRTSSTGGTRVMRVKTKTLRDKYEWGVIDELESTADKKISPKDIEIKVSVNLNDPNDEGRWMSLADFKKARYTSYKMWKLKNG